jgi:SP family general alpha glucoside:H+ symporter-like MFS transporter
LIGIVLFYFLSADTGAKHGFKTVFIFFGLGLGCAVLICFTIPDFTGRTFAQIDELFYRRIPARQFSKTECTGDYGKYVQQ